jgi:hypothetical protein
MQLKFITPDGYGELTITDILNKKGKKLEKADCNTSEVFISTDQETEAAMLLYSSDQSKR